MIEEDVKYPELTYRNSFPNEMNDKELDEYIEMLREIERNISKMNKKVTCHKPTEWDIAVHHSLYPNSATCGTILQSNPTYRRITNTKNTK
jgi:hypothetical protein